MKEAEERKITKSDLDQVESYADKLFAALGIDVEFTKHFMDRVNDARNKKQITSAELVRLFKQSYKKYGKKIAKMSDDANAVIHDMKTDINMPFVLNYRKGEVELVVKTIMRKKNFTTPASSPKLSFEQFRSKEMEMLKEVLKKRSEADRKKDAKKKAKWAKTAAGKKSALKSKKRAEKVRKGSVRVDKERSKSAKKTAKLYNGYSFKEFNESKSASGYEIYHKDFSTAMQHAYKMAKKLYGITVDPNEIDSKVASGPRKPSKGKTNKYRLEGDKGAVQIQVYNMDNKKYELNMYASG